MEISPLYNLIQIIGYGTKLHIGVIFLKNYNNQLCKLPREQEIHHSDMCDYFKTKSKASFIKCCHCSTFVTKKVLKTKVPFQGICINGIYEYTHPVIINNEVACIIFIGNILDNEKSLAKIKKHSDFDYNLIDTLEANFSSEQCINICRLIEDYILHLLDKTSQDTSADNFLIENIRNYVFLNLEYDINIKSVAEIFYYNPSYLGRLFKKETGMSFNNYITLCRIEKAKELLNKTEQSCIDISTKIGFNNVTYFTSIFKKHTGMSPTKYRKNTKNKNKA